MSNILPSSWFLFGIVLLFCALFLIFSTNTLKRYLQKYLHTEASNYLIWLVTMISAVYAVVVGFTIYYQSDLRNQARSAISMEVARLTYIGHAAEWLSPAAQHEITVIIKKYGDEVMAQEWDQMTKKIPIHSQGENLIHALRIVIYDAESDAAMRGKISHQAAYAIEKLMDSTRDLYGDRLRRLDAVKATIERSVWFAVLLQTAILLLLFLCPSPSSKVFTFSKILLVIFMSGVVFIITLLDQPITAAIEEKDNPFLSVKNYEGFPNLATDHLSIKEAESL